MFIPKAYRKYVLFGLLLTGSTSVGHGVDFTVQAQEAAFQKELIAYATTYYNGALSASSVFPGNMYFKIQGRRTSLPPVEKPILTSTAFDSCIAYGFANGLDEERRQDLNLIRSLQAGDTTYWQTYSVVISTIGQRYGYVFTSTGGIVNP
jgi:hypothetical protein